MELWDGRATKRHRARQHGSEAARKRGGEAARWPCSKAARRLCSKVARKEAARERGKAARQASQTWAPGRKGLWRSGQVDTLRARAAFSMATRASRPTRRGSRSISQSGASWPQVAAALARPVGGVNETHMLKPISIVTRDCLASQPATSRASECLRAPCAGEDVVAGVVLPWARLMDEGGAVDQL